MRDAAADGSGNWFEKASPVGIHTLASDGDSLVGLCPNGQKHHGASRAVGHNPISVIIPCHRVVGADGSLTGYAGGIPTKVRLLDPEDVGMDRLFAPPKGTAL